MSPTELAPLFEKCLNAGDLEGLASLYEADAVMASAEGPVSGIAAIRESLAGFLGMKPTMTFGNTTVLPMGDLVLLHSKWTLRGTGPDGPVEMGGLTSEVVRRQPDGSWKYILDDPFSEVPD